MNVLRLLCVLTVPPMLLVLPVWSASEVENRDGVLGGAHEATSKVTVAAHAIAYCNSSDHCTYTRVLVMGRTPIRFAVQLKSEPGAKDEAVDIVIQMWNWGRTEIVFETYWSTPIKYVPGQVTSMTFEDWPDALSKAQDPRYRLMAIVANAEGSIYDALEIPLFTSSSTERAPKTPIDPVTWGCVTLQTGKDNGAIRCVADLLESEGRNGNTEEAFRNLSRCLAPVRRAATIVGHGAAGEICTGDGDSCDAASKVISHNNAVKWLPHARSVKDRMSRLRLAACEVAAGKAGSDLLYKMAQATNTSVSGPTGFLYCDPKKGLSHDGVWKTATPKQRPRTVAEESEDRVPKGEDVVAVIDAVARVVRLNDVEVVAIVLKVDGGEHNITSRLDLGDNIRSHIAFGTPEITTSIPLALVTGHLEVRIRLGERSVSKTYRILANSRLQDTEDTTFYYRLDRKLKERLQELVEELREEE